MTDRTFLGEFEHGRTVRTGAVYVTLDRLEQKGLIDSELAEPDPERGGRPRRT